MRAKVPVGAALISVLTETFRQIEHNGDGQEMIPTRNFHQRLARFRRHGQKFGGVAETGVDGTGPIAELLSRPLKPMVFVAELACRKSFKLYVVLRIRCGNNNLLRPGVLKQDPLESGKPRRIKML